MQLLLEFLHIYDYEIKQIIISVSKHVASIQHSFVAMQMGHIIKSDSFFFFC